MAGCAPLPAASSTGLLCLLPLQSLSTRNQGGVLEGCCIRHSSGALLPTVMLICCPPQHCI